MATEPQTKKDFESLVEVAVRKPTLIQFTQNRSTLISYSDRGRVFHLRLHEIFKSAPIDVWEAITYFVAGRKKDARKIDAFVAENQSDRFHSPVPKRILPHGEVHDLQRMFVRLNETYFGSRIVARVTWSVAPAKRKRRSIRLGSYCEDQKIIRIHPALDRDFVPAYVVEAVLFHEMLHQVHKVELSPSGRRRVHSRSFRQDEARFPHYKKACHWERKNLARLLRA